MVDTDALVEMGRRVREWPMAPLALLGFFLAAGLVAMPLTLLIGATVVVFGGWPGGLYAMVGALASASLVYVIGRLAGRELIDEWLARHAGSRLDAINRQLERRGLVAIALLRLIPLPYSLVNLIAGASHIRFHDFVLGTALGLLPVIVLLAGLSTRLEAWLADPDWQQALALVGVLVVAGLVAWTLQRWVARDQRP